MRTFAALLVGVFSLLLALAPADAATAIYYSKPDATYGWCAGYSYSRSESCARDQCVDAGGKACELAIECDGGWGAIAFADGSILGAGAACNADRQAGARAGALLACVAANRARCSTSDTFSSRGNQTSEQANEDFDLAFYAQLLLSIAGYDPGLVDGQMGGQTRAAIRAFQADIGFEQTGGVDRDLLTLLSYAAHGTNVLSDAADKHLRDDTKMAEHTFAGSKLVPLRQSFTTELMAKTDLDRRTAMAVILGVAHFECSLPAAAAAPMGGKAGPDAWDVKCAEGNYLVRITGSRAIISRTAGGGTEP